MKSMPQNIDAEKSVIGSLLLDPASYDLISDLVEDTDFYNGANRKIFGAITELARKNAPIDLVSMNSHLRDRGELEAIGGTAYLATLIDFTPSSVNIEHYAKLVKEKAILRRLLSVSEKTSQRVLENDFEDLEKLLSEVEESIFGVSQHSTTVGPLHSMEIVKASLKQIEDLYNKKGALGGLSSGFSNLDKMTAGFWPGDLIIVAARPAMGKTSFCMNIAQYLTLRENKSVVVFSLEMEKTNLMARVLSSESRIPFSDLRVGRVSDSSWPKLIGAADKLSSANLYIDDSSGLDPYEIRARARRLKAKAGLDLVIIDYLQIMTVKSKIENHQLAIAEISKNMKALAKELGIPVIVLSQLSRATEKRDNKRPMLSDLRDSGSIEQDADLVAMIYRDEYYDDKISENKGEVEIIIAKQRNGQTGSVKLNWLGQFCTFVNPIGSA